MEIVVVYVRAGGGGGGSAEWITHTYAGTHTKSVEMREKI